MMAVRESYRVVPHGMLSAGLRMFGWDAVETNYDIQHDSIIIHATRDGEHKRTAKIPMHKWGLSTESKTAAVTAAHYTLRYGQSWYEQYERALSAYRTHCV